MRQDSRAFRTVPDETGAGPGILAALGSLRVTLALLVLLGFVCALGTLVPAGDSWSDLRRFLVVGVGRLFLATGLSSPFTSVPFRGLLALLALNLLLCTWRRLPSVLRELVNPTVTPGAGLFDATEFRARAPAAGRSVEEVEEAAGVGLASLGYARAGATTGPDGSRVVLFRRGAAALAGPHLAHLGVLLLFLGGATGWYLGVEGFGEAPRGGSFDVYDPAWYGLEAELKRLRFRKAFLADVEREGAALESDVVAFRALERRERELAAEQARLAARPAFSVRVLDAREERYGDGQASGWTSTLEVQERGVAVARQDVQVNTPLSWRGMGLFQHSFAWRAAPGSDVATEPAGEVVVARGKRTSVDKLPLAVEVLEYYPDFAVEPGEGGQPHAVSRSDEPRNQAVRVLVQEEEGQPREVFLFKAEPFAVHEDPASRWSLRLVAVEADGRFRLSLRERVRVPWTGLGIQYDPGTPLVWLGSLLLLAGMALAFVVEQRRVYLRVDGAGALRVAGLPSKFPGLYHEEFGRVAAALGASPETGEQGGEGA